MFRRAGSNEAKESADSKMWHRPEIFILLKLCDVCLLVMVWAPQITFYDLMRNLRFCK